MKIKETGGRKNGDRDDEGRDGDVERLRQG